MRGGGIAYGEGICQTLSPDFVGSSPKGRAFEFVVSSIKSMVAINTRERRERHGNIHIDKYVF